MSDVSLISREVNPDKALKLALYRAAFDLALRGIPVFPCICGGKAPAITGGFYQATTDLAQIDAWFGGDGPPLNIGVALGPAGLCGVDLDVKKGNGIAEWNALPGEKPRTYTVRSPSEGLHYWFEGSLPASVGKLAPNIDTRGERSYVLAPPSVVDGKSYEVVDDAPPAPLPAWIAEALGKQDRTKHEAISARLDQPHQIDRAKAYLAKVSEEQGPWGQDDEPDTYAIAAYVKDIGISEETAVDLLMEHLAEDEHDWIAQTVGHVYKYGQNEPGCGEPGSPERKYGDPNDPVYSEFTPSYDADAEPSPNATQGKDGRRRFMFRSPEEDASRPPLTYWDDQRPKSLLPRLPGGAAVIVVGKRSTYKSGVILKECLDACLNKGARVLYLAPEGAHGIQTARLPAACLHRVYKLAELTGRWVTHEVAPGLVSPGEIDELIAACREQHFAPDIVVIDTMTRAAPGADINAPAVGAALIEGMEMIAREFNATVLAVTHPGKVDRGAIGSTLIESLAYAIWRVSLLDDRTVRVWLDKMKDGPAEFAVLYRVEHGINGVPVVVDMPLGERSRYGVADDPKERDRLALKRDVLEVLRSRWGAGNTTPPALPAIAAALITNTDEHRENATQTIEKRLRRNALEGGKPGTLAELMVCDKRGVPLSHPYTFRAWPEVESVARRLGLAGDQDNEGPDYEGWRVHG